MSKIDRFDGASCGAVADAAMEALAAVAESFGLTLVRQAGRYSDSAFTFKAEFKATAADGAPADFALTARLLGLPEDCWGKELMVAGRACRITGLDLKKRKYPVLTTALDGSPGYRYTPGMVKAALELEALRAGAGSR